VTRVLLKSALVVAAIALTALIVAAGLAIWAAGSESGLRFVWERVVPRLPSGVSIETVNGRLVGSLVLGGIAIRTETLELRIERAELEWHPRALLAQTLDIERLDLRGVDIVRLSGEPPSARDEPFNLPERIDLPVDVAVARASLETFRYRASPESEPLLIERASLSGRLDHDALSLRDLAVHGPLFDLSAEASVVPRDAYETSGRVDWVFRPDAYPEARGSARFAGNREALAIEQRVEAPYDARADVRLTEPLTALRVDGELALDVPPAALGIEGLPVDTIGSTLRLRGSLDALDVTAHVKLAGQEVDGVEANLEGRYAGDALEIHALEIVEPAAGAAIRASGRVTPGGAQPTLELDATWAQLKWPLRGEAQVASHVGTLELRGTLNDYALALEGDLALADGTAGKVSVSGTGDAHALTLATIDVEALAGRILGRADAIWAPKLSGAVELTGVGLDPGVLLDGWPGRLGARVRAAATFEGEALTVELHELAIDGQLRDRAIDLTARGAYTVDTVRVDAFSLRSGATEVSARGTAGPSLALEWRLESPDLGDLGPELAGRITAHGELRGPRERPRVGVEARAQSVRFEGSDVDDFELAADVDVAGKGQSSLALAVTSARVQGIEIQQLRLTGDGDAARHGVALTATTSVGNAELALTGNVADPWTRRFAWSFALDTATLAYPELAPWRLREPAAGRITQAEAEIAQACWQSGTADLCIGASRGRDRTEARLALSNLRFDYFAALLAEPVQLDGDMSLEGTFDQPANGMPRFDVELRASRGLLVSGDAEQPHELAFGPADGRVSMSDDRFEGTLRVPFAEQGELEASARIGSGAGAPFGARSLDGRLLLDIASLDFVADLVTQVTNTQGTVSGDLGISGTVADPQVAGTLALAGGKATVPATNAELEDLELTLTGDGARGLTIGGQARSGGGSLGAVGRLALAGNGPEGRIAVDGDAFEVVDTVDAQVVVSPDLDLTLTHDGIELTGSVTVPRARLTPRDTGEAAVTASGDQVIVASRDEAVRAPTRPFAANVRLALGDDVQVDGYGLTGRLVGAIAIAEKPGEPTTGTGELRVENGVYEAYGQKLTIESGRVVFAGGPITQPGVDIEAVRRPTADIVVGARVRGLLAEPQLSVFSEPPMPQQEQLSYLVLGRPLESASASESSAMSRAALALGLKGGNFVSERINQNLGLDAFGIETDPGEAPTAAAFVIGKYLTPSLYVSYGIGLFDPVNTLKLRYAISKRWRLVTESSSEASGGDVIYNIERGR
jgi:translocation and assembly module TamB